MRALALLLALGLAACAQERAVEFQPSGKSAVELRAMQVRVIDGDTDTVMRGVIATLHDLGYRITRADANTGTVSATRRTALRMAVVVQPKPPGRQSIVRANATLVGLGREVQVDSPEFYTKNFYNPLADTMHRTAAILADDEPAPDAARPVAERGPTRVRGTVPTASQPASANQERRP